MRLSRTQRHEDRCHALWQRAHKPFLFPEWAKHEHEWEAYDLCMAGCKHCGLQHLCSVNTCPYVKCDDGTLVCTITGLCLESLTVSNKEFSDCATTSIAEKDECSDLDGELHTMVFDVLRELLLSNTTATLLRLEHDKLTRRRIHLFHKNARRIKTHEKNPNLIDIFTETINQTVLYRTPYILPEQSLLAICQQCTTNIFRVFKLLRINNDKRGWKRSIQRMKSIVVGLVYMTRTGVMWNDTVILPYMSVMNNVLPHEVSLQQIMGLRPKIITETENFIKTSMRSICIGDIMRYLGDQHTML